MQLISKRALTSNGARKAPQVCGLGYWKEDVVVLCHGEVNILMAVPHVKLEVVGIRETFVTVITDHILLRGWPSLHVEDCLVALEVPQ